MSTITEDINKVIQIKNDLNEVLRENGIEGGRVFEEYPEKFRELFRILQDQTEEVVDEYTGPNEIETFVAKPEISWFENVVTLTCPTQGATIYYMVKSKSGNYDKGWGPYMNKFYIKEDVYVEAFARYNNVDSAKPNNSANIPYYKGQVPDEPVIVRDGTTVTITCTGTYTSIWWSTVNGNYVQYTGPVTVQRNKDVYAYSTYNRFASDIVKDEAPEQIIIPEMPTIDCTLNIITMETETENATIWYMIKGDDEWIEYEGEIEIFESGWYRAKAVLNGIESFATNYVLCEYIAAPAEPDITCSNNTVTIEAEEGAVIYYRFEGDEDWILYDEPFVISDTVTVEAYCHKDGFDSDEASVECEYVAPEIGTVGSCSISNNNNRITIACSQTPDATIYYCVTPTELEDMRDLSQYSIYEGPFYITEDTYIYAHAVRPPYTANSWTKSYFTYTEPVEPPSDRLNVPFIAVSNNIVYMSTDVPGGTIYYKKANDDEYHLYTGGIPITETTTFLAFVTKDDKTSDIVSQQCIYVAPTAIKPARPSIVCEDNVVTIVCTTSGAVIYYRIGNGQWNIYTEPISITETCTVEAYSYKDGEISDTVTKECEFRHPKQPIITCDLNSVTIISPDGGEIWYKIDDGEYTLYTEEFNITSQCTITAYVHKWNVDSELSTLECEYNENILYTSRWFNTNYYQYKLPITKYSELTSTSQLYNKRVLVEGNDKVRFIEYKSGSSYKIFMQFEDRKFALYTKAKGEYRLISSNFYTTTELSQANGLFQTEFNLSEFTSRNVSTDDYNIGLRSFDKDTYYATNDYQGRATLTFKLPYLVSNSSGTMSITSKEMYLKYLLGIYINNITSNVLRNGRLRFKPINKDVDLPIIWQRYIYGQYNGVTIWESAHCYDAYSYYEVILV